MPKMSISGWKIDYLTAIASNSNFTRVFSSENLKKNIKKSVRQAPSKVKLRGLWSVVMLIT